MGSHRIFTIGIVGTLAAVSFLSIGRVVSSQLLPIANGVNYLKTAQNSDGSWGGTATSLNSIFPTSTTALEALRALESTPSPAQTNAIQFLTSQTIEAAPFLAGRIVALAGIGSDTTADLNTLLSTQNADGGWGTADGFESDALDTSFALLALNAANVANTGVLAPALRYLTTHQNSNGGWGLTPGEDSQVFYTALALQALNSFRQQFTFATSQTRALAFLRRQQNPDGGYGSPTSTAFETALTLLAMFEAGQSLTPAETEAVNFLTSTQLANGSWADDAYSTALVLRALASPRDTDADGIPDEVETANGLDINNASDALGDLDDDGLSNRQEFELGTSLTNSDTDGDSVDDPTEVFSGSDPLNPDSANRPPVITSQPTTTASEEQLYTYRVQTTDPDDDVLTLQLLQAPSGMSLARSGRIEWTPSAAQVGRFSVLIQASDGRGGTALQQFQVTVLARGVDLTVAGVNTSAVITTPQTLVIGGQVSVDIQNLGGSPFDGSFAVLVFEDRNDNGTFEQDADQVVGAATFDDTLASNAVASLEVRVSGVLLFQDNLLRALVDSAEQVPELDETNALGHSGLGSIYQPPPAATQDWQPVVEWEWNRGTLGVSHPPTVAPLIDTNGDGLINQRDIPAVIFVWSNPFGADQLVALRGDSGEEIFAVSPPDRDFSSAGHTPAVGDIDGDGVPEIILAAFLRNPLYAFNNDGTLKWTLNDFTALDSGASNAALADLDNDGRPEILYGKSVVNADGTLRWTTPNSYIGGRDGSRQAVDLDLDGVPEILGGAAAFDRDGRRIWAWQTPIGGVGGLLRAMLSRHEEPFVEQFQTTAGLSEEWVAVANLDEDAFPEVIAVSNGPPHFVGTTSRSMWIFEHDGEIHAGPFPLFFDVINEVRFNVGPPTVADVDGDGQIEIAIAANRLPSSISFADPRRSLLTVYRPDGSVVWQREMERDIHETYAPPTSAFDFDGDGAFEIVYQDKHKLYILNGSDGTSRFELGVGRDFEGAQPNRYPTVADVDNDGNAEIIVPTADNHAAITTGAPTRTGILVLGDSKDNWLHARRIWNQWQYDATNVNEDATVPAMPRNGWQMHNTHRAQLPIDGLRRFAAPDVTVSRVTMNALNCPTSVGITARIGNGGSLHVASGVVVHLYLGDPDADGVRIATAQTTRALYPGEFEDVTVDWNNPTAGQVYVTVNEMTLGAMIAADNLSLLPHTWAQSSGLGPALVVPVNYDAHNAIDGSSTTDWYENRPPINLDPRPPFFEVRFPFPVNAASVTVENRRPRSQDVGFQAGELTFSNGFAIPISLDANGEGTVAFPEQADITWIRLTASSTRPDGAAISEFIVAGSYREPILALNEGTGRLNNNKATSVFSGSPCNMAANQPPQINSAPPITADLGVPYSYAVQATDPNQDILNFALVTAPAGMSIDDVSGVITWTSTETGTFAVTLQVLDARGGMDMQSFMLEVIVPAGINRPPQITSVPPGTVRLGQRYRYDVAATDADGDNLVFVLRHAPTAATIDRVSGMLTWTPTLVQLGTQYFTLDVHDGRGQRAVQTFTVTVTPATTPVPPGATDEDDDGFDSTVDCDDTSAAVNPAQAEIPGNGLDDDCNAATPDTVEATAVDCALVSDRRSYTSRQLAQLTATLTNQTMAATLEGLQSTLRVQAPDGAEVLTASPTVITLSPQQTWRTTMTFATETHPPGMYTAQFAVDFAATRLCQATLEVPLRASGTASTALSGAITAEPSLARPGQEVVLQYRVENIGNVAFEAVTVQTFVTDAITEEVIVTFTATVPLAMAATFQATQVLPRDLAVGDYLVLLQGDVGDGPETLASAPLRIQAPTCDVNGDGQPTPQDVVQLLHHFGGVARLDAGQQVSADADGNGRITPADGRCCLQRFLQVPSCLDE